MLFDEIGNHIPSKCVLNYTPFYHNYSTCYEVYRSLVPTAIIFTPLTKSFISSADHSLSTLDAVDSVAFWVSFFSLCCATASFDSISLLSFALSFYFQFQFQFRFQDLFILKQNKVSNGLPNQLSTIAQLPFYFQHFECWY